MSVAGASLLVGVALVTLAGAAWLAVLAATEQGIAHEYRRALCDWALAALAVHVLALLVGGTASPAAYGLTVVLAGAAVWFRQPVADREAEPEPELIVVEGPEPARPAPPASRSGTLWAREHPGR